MGSGPKTSVEYASHYKRKGDHHGSTCGTIQHQAGRHSSLSGRKESHCPSGGFGIKREKKDSTSHTSTNFAIQSKSDSSANSSTRATTPSLTRSSHHSSTQASTHSTPQNPQLIFILRGDASLTCDDPVEAKQILGKVASVEKRGRSIDLYSRKAKILCLAYVWASRFKRLIVRVLKAHQAIGTTFIGLQ